VLGLNDNEILAEGLGEELGNGLGLGDGLGLSCQQTQSPANVVANTSSQLAPALVAPALGVQAKLLSSSETTTQWQFSGHP